MSAPTLTPAVRRGDPRCGCREAPTTPTCGRPATWHILWHRAPQADFSLVCGAHMAWVRDRFVYLDRHPATIACDMPGTGWCLGQPSFCTIPSNDQREPDHE
ncbi:hypothetical protein [Streptomyces sp. NPDC016626]|uniref:hypothetical protein n=1 Tax=Streptomyces sp. NPDC016626 TaxID=3364968 RepID=UPI0037034E95